MEYGIDRKQVRNYRDQGEQIIDVISKKQVQSNQIFRVRGNHVELKFKKIEEFMYERIIQYNKENKQISVIKLKQLVKPNFSKTKYKLSNGFIENLFKRYSLTYRKANKVIIIDEKFIEQNMNEFTVQLIRYFEQNPKKKLWCNMNETRVELDIKENQTIHTVGTQSVKILKSNNGEKQDYTVVLSGFNNGGKLPPMIIFNGIVRIRQKLWILRDA